jgi:hypothetical protein
MAYQLDRFNGTFLVNVDDGSIETNSTDLRFVGKNYAGYGEVQNENFLHLLENFSNTTPPPKVISGQIWYDNANKKLKFYDGTRFRVAGGAEVGTAAPSGLAIGEFWWDTSAKQLYTWTGVDFVLIGPEASPDLGSASAVSQVVKDITGGNHTILKLIAGGKAIGIVNLDDQFTLNSTLNPIEDFSIIRKGFNLVKTNSSGVSSDDFAYWGSASNALRLGGIEANEFVQKGDVTFDQEILFKDPGFQLGDGNDLRVRVENNDEVVFENRLGNDITFRISVSPLDRRNVGVFTSNGIDPGDDLVYDLGRTGVKWKTIYAGTVNSNLVGNVTGNITGVHTGNLLANDSTVMVNASTKQIGYPLANIVGELTGNVQGNVVGTASSASSLNNIPPSVSVPVPLVSSIPIRDASGNIIANQFVGTADRADRLKIDNAASDTDPNYRSAKTTAVANTIAARDGSGNLLAVLFDGTATAARYADLAEKYLPDSEYDVGTVVAVGGEKEITACVDGDRAIGVISANPAFMMNKDLEGGVYVALKGRVPVKVIGPIKKGQRLIASNDGCAIADTSYGSSLTFAVSLETNDNDGLKVIEALVL